MSPMNPETRARLSGVSTATLCTALFKRGLRNQFIQDVHPLNPKGAPMVGEAFTLRYIPAREDLNPISVFQDRAHPQRKAVEDCPPGAVFVIDSRKDPRAASAGSILVTRLMVRGVAGIVTDGGFRDSPEIATFATGIGPAKALLDGRSDIVRAAHSRNLTVTPYTFTTRSAAGSGRFTSVSDEMRYYLTELDVDALFTDNPDRFPR